MTCLRDHFDSLTVERRVFWLQTAGAHECNGRHARFAIDTWEHSHGMTRERATLEFIAWLIIARESLGIEGYGNA
jgi:hypothetical protein